MNLDQPVDENAPHSAVDGRAVQIVLLDGQFPLQVPHVVVDVVDVHADQLRVEVIVPVNVLNVHQEALGECPAVRVATDVHGSWTCSFFLGFHILWLGSDFLWHFSRYDFELLHKTEEQN